MKKLSQLALITLTPIAAHAGSVPVELSFDISQGSYSEGASVTGMFSAIDLNLDGVITSIDGGGAPTGELTSFMLTFSGNSIVPAFTLDLAASPFLVYELSGGPEIGDVSSEILDAGDFTTGFGYVADASVPGAVFSPFFDTDETVEPLVAFPKDGGSKLPDTGSAATFLALGLAGLAGAQRRRA